MTWNREKTGIREKRVRKRVTLIVGEEPSLQIVLLEGGGGSGVVSDGLRLRIN